MDSQNTEKILAVQRMQDFIAANICRPITLHDLGRAAGYSPWHSAHLFREWTGQAPFDYIRSLRLSHAAFRLQNTDERIVDVAFDFVFDSHEGFTRAFSKAFGQSPKAFRQHPRPVRLFLPEPVRLKLHEQIGNRLAEQGREGLLPPSKGEILMSDQIKSSAIFVQVVDRPERKLILRRGIKATDYYEYCEEVGCEIWDVLSAVKEALYEPIGMWLPDHLIAHGTSQYAQGVEVPVDYSGPVPENCDLIDLPACKMMVFQGEPYDDEQFEEAIGEVWEKIKAYNPELYGFKWTDEDGPRFQLAPMGYRGYIEGRPVRTVQSE